MSRRSGSTAARVSLAAVSAGALVLAMPGFGLPALAWVALVPLLVAMRGASPLGAMGLGAVAGTVFYTVHCGWLTETVGPLQCALLAVGSGLWLGAFGGVARAVGRRAPGWRWLTLPAAWVVIEWLRVHADFVALPFGTIAHSQYEVLPVAALASVTGVHGVSFVIVSVNTGLAEIVGRRTAGLGASLRLPSAAVAAVACLAILGFVGVGPGATREGARGPTLRVAVVQAGVHDSRDRRTPAPGEIGRRYVQRSLDLATRQPELIAWPASSVPYDLSASPGVRRKLRLVAEKLGTPLLVGSSGRDKSVARAYGSRPAANSAFLFGEGGLIARYDKMRLLPFNEYLPQRGRLPWPGWLASNAVDAAAGTERTIFDLDGARFGVLICWESLFAGDFREAAQGDVDFMVSMTNEGFTRSKRAHAQMLAMNVFRAIENHVSIVRAATTGVSALIGPDGRILGRVEDAEGRPVEVVGDLLGSIPLTRSRSYYSRAGDWLVALLSGLLVVAALRGSPARSPAHA